MKGKIARLSLAGAAAISLLAIATAPAGAAGPVAGAGIVHGRVDMTDGYVPPLIEITKPCPATTYEFTGIVISGGFTDGTAAYAGQLGVPDPVSGGAVGLECFQLAQGTVEQFTPFATGIRVGTVHEDSYLKGTGGSPTSGSGGFARSASIVLVKLVGRLSFSGAPPAPATLLLAAQFTPDRPMVTGGITDRVYGATFDGIYVVAPL